MSQTNAPDRRNDLRKRDREVDPTPRRTRSWFDAEMVLIVGMMAAVMALLVFTLHSYSPRLTAVPQISTSEPTTTGQGR